MDVHFIYLPILFQYIRGMIAAIFTNKKSIT